jgi:predicted nucleic acid-binding Zn ribbon protein
MRQYNFKTSARKCAQCSGVIPAGTSATRKYCSEECSYQNKRELLKRKKAAKVKPRGKCIICDASVPRPNQLYCSDLCKSKDPRTRVHTDVYKNQRILKALPGLDLIVSALKAKWLEGRRTEQK